MARRESSLPIEDDRGFVSSGADETNVEKCLWAEIGTRDIDYIGRGWTNNRSIKYERFRDRSWRQIRGNIDFGGRSCTESGSAGIAASQQYSPIHEQGSGMVRARRDHF